MKHIDSFGRLAPFIQEFVYRKGWTALRPFQEEAIAAILDTPDHLLLMSGTASGKTEAVMLPILTLLEAQPSASISALYISPLKALINDQFGRLQELLRDSEIPFQNWHGDVGQSKKRRFKRVAQGILQITPESLEALLMNHHGDLRRLFGDLRFIIIDEIHAFLENDRGQQVLCQLQRLARYQRQPARRIGLSATIGEPDTVKAWLASGTQQETRLIKDDANQKRTIDIGLSHYCLEPIEKIAASNPEESASLTLDHEIDSIDAPKTAIATKQTSDAHQVFYEHLFRMVCRGQKTLIFVNSRRQAETIAAALRQRETSGRDWFHVHHASISAELRVSAEEALRDPTQRCCVIATSTLELGIDIGQLDQVIQVGCSATVSSMVQRLGRSGRREVKHKKTISRMYFYSIDPPPSPGHTTPEPYAQIPWNFVQQVAMLQLFIEHKWLEPPTIPQYPWSLLYQQTMSILCAEQALTQPRLLARMKALPPFRAVAEEQFRQLLVHLKQIEHIAQTDEDELIVGLRGAKVVHDWHFYATFVDSQGYEVICNGRHIGYVSEPPVEGGLLGLAGFAWRVLHVVEKPSVIYVEPAHGEVEPNWLSFGDRRIHERVAASMRHILWADDRYAYLDQDSFVHLEQARAIARSTDMLTQPIVPMVGGGFALFPWQGSRMLKTLELRLQCAGYRVWNREFYLETALPATDIATCQRLLSQLALRQTDPNELLRHMETKSLWRHKYDYLIPRPLLQAAYLQETLALDTTTAWLQSLATSADRPIGRLSGPAGQ